MKQAHERYTQISTEIKASAGPERFLFSRVENDDKPINNIYLYSCVLARARYLCYYSIPHEQISCADADNFFTFIYVPSWIRPFVRSPVSGAVNKEHKTQTHNKNIVFNILPFEKEWKSVAVAACYKRLRSSTYVSG